MEILDKFLFAFSTPSKRGKRKQRLGGGLRKYEPILNRANISAYPKPRANAEFQKDFPVHYHCGGLTESRAGIFNVLKSQGP